MGDLTLNIRNPHRSTCISCSYDEDNWFYNQELFYLVNHLLASISILFSEQRKTEEPHFQFWPSKKWNEIQKMKEGGGEGNLSPPPPQHSFTHTIFHLVCDSHSLFLALKPHRNACYAGQVKLDVSY